MDLELQGTRVRVVVEDVEARTALKSIFATSMIDEPAAIGFVLKRGSGSSGLHLLVDRTGFVLARTRSATDGLLVLIRHLNSFVPPTAGAVRYRMRTLVNDRGMAVLAAFPLFTEPAPSERRLERYGYRIVDRLHVDVNNDGSGHSWIAPSTPASAPIFGTVQGHVEMPDKSTAIRALLIPTDTRLSRAETVLQVAASAIDTSDPASILAHAEGLVTAAPVRPASIDGRTAPYDALNLI